MAHDHAGHDHAHAANHSHGHDHGHTHGHAHGHAHNHGPVSGNFGIAFGLATLINFTLVAAEVIYGLSAHSVALLADAGHNFGDGLGLLMAWGAAMLGRALPTERFTYGFRSASIHAALINAVLLLVATGAIALEAVRRLGEPHPVGGATVMIVAAGAIVANGLAAWLLMSGRKDDLNIRAAFAHLVADACVSAGVVVAGAAILFTGGTWIDPVVSLVISAVIVWGTWSLLAESVRLAMDAVPNEIRPVEVRQFLETLPGVTGVHDLHIWAMSTTENALTAHLVMPAGHPGDAFLVEICERLDLRFKINHPTVQIEMGDATPCMLEPASRV
jgi:cobalt-zinc-cadmium efflux system protein